jgi:hypothetical protein
MKRELFRVEKKFLSCMRLIMHSNAVYGSDSLIHISSIYFDVLFLHRCIFDLSTHKGALKK